MTNTQCMGCRFANWKKTEAGKLHPSGLGRCTRLDQYPLDFRIPPAFYWVGVGRPSPSGGTIERKHPLKDRCVFKDGSKP